MGKRIVTSRMRLFAGNNVGRVTAASPYALSLDLSTGTLPDGLTYARTGAQYVQTSATTAVSVAANAPAYETRDGWTGLWTHPAYTNDLPADMTGAGWSRLNVTPSLNSVVAPDGTTTAAATVDTSAGANGAVYKTGLSSNKRYHAAWVRDDAVSPPTGGPGSLTGSTSLNLSDSSISLGTGTSWRRIELIAQSTSTSAWCAYVDGAQYNANFTPASTGGVDLWGWTSTVSNTHLPLTPPAEVVGAATVTLSAAQAGACVDNGALDIEWTGIASWAIPGNTPAFTAWSLDSGNHKLVFTGGSSGGTIQLYIGGALKLTATGVSWANIPACKYLQAINVRAWWNTSANSCGIQATVNGVYNVDVSGTTTGGALTAPADGWIGSLSGSSSYAPVRHRRFIAHKSTATRSRQPKGALLGDSTMGAINSDSYMPMFLRAAADMFGAPLFCSAIAGNTTAQQKTAWSALPAGEKATLSWVYLQTGLNDLNPATGTSATRIAAIQDLVDTVRAAVPAACKILIGSMVPFKTQLGTAFPGTDANGKTSYQQWQDLNEAIAGSGGTPITGVDARVTSYVAALNNGSDDLAVAYRGSDGYHPNEAARQVIAAALNTSLGTLGLTS